MSRYGQLYKIADFIERSIQTKVFKSSSSSNSIDLLKMVDALQHRNLSVNYTIQAGGELRLFFKGALLFTVKPAKGHLRLIIGKQWNSDATSLSKQLRKMAAGNEGFTTSKHSADHYQWQMTPHDAGLLFRKLNSLKMLKANNHHSTKKHPRYFSKEAQTLALNEFIDRGSWCPGFGSRKKHKVRLDQGDRIELDHIIAYASGGSSSQANLQVLCYACNRSKGAR